MKRPHILLITTDQQRGDCLGLDGHPVLSTPNLDALGGNGAFFQHAYSEVPSCIAARRILLTGLDQLGTGMVGYQDGQEWNPPFTLPGELSKAGYQTHLVGKLHYWPQRKRFGFQSMAWSDGPYTGLRGGDDDYTHFLQRHGFEADAGISHGLDPNGWTARPWHLEERFSFEHWCVSEAIDFLKRRDPSAPFFLNLSFFAPHPPLAPPQVYYDRYSELELPPPEIGDWADASAPVTGIGAPDTNASRLRMNAHALQRCRAAYYGLINHVDDQIGRLFRALSHLGLGGDTLVLFTSDHGEMLGDHHLFRKTFPYEASARVPFLVRAPQWMDCRRNTRVAAPVGLQDVCPTLLEAAGVKQPDGVAGKSVLPWLRGEQPQWRDFLHGEHAPCYRNEDGNHFLTNGREKYIWWTQTGAEQFFDLSRDPHEKHDLINDNAAAARVEVWRKRLVARLESRPEGFSDGHRLVPGRAYPNLLHPSARQT